MPNNPISFWARVHNWTGGKNPSFCGEKGVWESNVRRREGVIFYKWALSLSQNPSPTTQWNQIPADFLFDDKHAFSHTKIASGFLYAPFFVAIIAHFSPLWVSVLWYFVPILATFFATIWHFCIYFDHSFYQVGICILAFFTYFGYIFPLFCYFYTYILTHFCNCVVYLYFGYIFFPLNIFIWIKVSFFVNCVRRRWGGCMVALCDEGQLAPFLEGLKNKYYSSEGDEGIQKHVFVTQPGAGASILEWSANNQAISTIVEMLNFLGDYKRWQIFMVQLIHQFLNFFEIEKYL